MFTMLQKFSIEQKFECPWSSCKRDTKLTNLRYENKILFFSQKGEGGEVGWGEVEGIIVFSGMGLIRGLISVNLLCVFNN